MFEFFFNYPLAALSKGKLVLLGAWPAWLLPVMIGIVALALGFLIWRRHRAAGPSFRGAVVWLLQPALLALLLLMLWQPALSIATLKPQQNIVAVVVDDSRSMNPHEHDGTRRDEAIHTLNNGLLQSLRNRFQVRLYRLGDTVERIDQ